MNYTDRYIGYLKKFVRSEKPFKVVFDASNGPAGKIIHGVLKDDSKITFELINDDIDPDFTAHGPNPLAPGASKQCAQKVIATRADLGVIFDADGDRAIFLNNSGVIMEPYLILAILSKTTPGPYVVDEIIYNCLNQMKLISSDLLIQSKVGSYFIKEKIREHNAQLGIELSGHYYFKDFFNSDSGIVAALKVIEALSRSTDNQISQINHPKLILDELIVTNDLPWASIEADLSKKFKETHNIRKLDGITVVGKNEWLNIRKSNTEPLLRITGGGRELEAKKLIVDVKKIISESK